VRDPVTYQLLYVDCRKFFHNAFIRAYNLDIIDKYTDHDEAFAKRDAYISALATPPLYDQNINPKMLDKRGHAVDRYKLYAVSTKEINRLLYVFYTKDISGRFGHYDIVLIGEYPSRLTASYARDAYLKTLPVQPLYKKRPIGL